VGIVVQPTWHLSVQGHDAKWGIAPSLNYGYNLSQKEINYLCGERDE
jgi:hypothetical protein